MALQTDLNHTHLKVNHHLKKTHNNDTTTQIHKFKYTCARINSFLKALNMIYMGFPPAAQNFLVSKGGGPQWETRWKSREAPEKAYSMLIESGFAETVVLSVV